MTQTAPSDAVGALCAAIRAGRVPDSDLRDLQQAIRPVQVRLNRFFEPAPTPAVSPDTRSAAAIAPGSSDPTAWAADPLDPATAFAAATARRDREQADVFAARFGLEYVDVATRAAAEWSALHPKGEKNRGDRDRYVVAAVTREQLRARGTIQ